MKIREHHMKILCAILSALLVMATGCIIYLYQGTLDILPALKDGDSYSVQTGA